MKQSETIGNLALALSKAQGAMQPAKMNATNPFLKSKYADLGSVMDAAKQPLADNGLSFVQMVSAPDNGNMTVELTTMLMHESGEYLQATMSMPFQEERGKSLSQAVGSVITYARRYALAAMLGIVADEDVDGTGPTGQPAKPKKAKPEPTLADNDTKRKEFHATGGDLYGPAWKRKGPELVAHFDKESSNDLTLDEAAKLVDGMRKKLAKINSDSEALAAHILDLTGDSKEAAEQLLNEHDGELADLLKAANAIYQMENS